VEGKEEYPVTAVDIRANVRAFEAITRSARSGRIEKV
jgi:hypothetical protein